MISSKLLSLYVVHFIIRKIIYSIIRQQKNSCKTCSVNRISEEDRLQLNVSNTFEMFRLEFYFI